MTEKSTVLFYADRQKGVTRHDETGRENPRGIDCRNDGKNIYIALNE